MTESPLLLALRVFLEKDRRGHFELRRLRNCVQELGIQCSYRELRIALRSMDADISRRRLDQDQPALVQKRPRLVWGYRIRYDALAQMSVKWGEVVEAERIKQAQAFAKKEPPPWQGT